VSEEPDTAEARDIAREILRSLEKHPEAKDTVDGIARWWFRRERSGRLHSDVEQAVSLLLSQGLILETRRKGVSPYYRLNPQQGAAIAKLLKGS
jgi:DNA-binding transcriptional ArsR family regulator